jgi:hypothetical protein
MSESPTDLPSVDPEQFVGGAPTGEADPVGFTSGDQSTDAPADDPADASTDDEEDS